MGRPAEWMKNLTSRGAMRSPGAPSHRREIERRFWEQIRAGITSEKAAEVVGVSQAVGTRWFRHRGGMPLFMSQPESARYLSFAEREEIGLLRAQERVGRDSVRIPADPQFPQFNRYQYICNCLELSHRFFCLGIKRSLRHNLLRRI